ncbi:ABC-F family ATP-binding cassette domain-containing protein [Varunaivibrio sulfuroxidans]|nr:ABC-F family ATP-binding cassette domain-containing protein [Varunaivibrio sulfuroxidans]
MLHINDITYRISGRILFDQATLAVSPGHKIGLVGRNGAGKSTLFRLINGQLTPDGGSITVRKRARVGQVAQEVPAGADSLLDTVLKADTERSALLHEAETATAPHRIAEIHTRLADIGAHSAPARAASILSGLGFDSADQDRPCSDFSGGWRMRVALAAVLFSQPDLLLLDEPTNHLDLEATLWLENYLANWPGTLLVISHDRTLLNAAVNHIVHLENGKLNRYTGGYDRFENTRREQMAIQSKMQSRQMEQRRHIEQFVERFRYTASKARQAQSRLKMLERMQPIASVAEAKTTTFRFPDPSPLPPPLLALEDASVGYQEGRPILKGLDMRIDMDDRIALLGANGNGKSTLIRLLAGRLKAQTGKVIKSSKLEVGYFAQHQSEELPLSDTPYRHMQRLMEMATETKVRAHLGRFGFSGDKADTQIASLSGGEKARLLFATMSFGAPHIMFLDEPTNHLDVDAREALVTALNDYDGAVILVSHDPHLIELVCERLWIVDQGTCRAYDGDMEDYRRLLLERRRQPKQNADGEPTGRPDKKAERRKRAQARSQSAPLRKAVRDAENVMARLEREKDKTEKRLADPTIYEGTGEDIAALQKELGRIETALSKAENAWLDASDALERAQLTTEA